MCGGTTDSGFTPTRYVMPKNMEHAYNILRGEKQYVDWTKTNEVVLKARLLFENGYPYYPALSGASVLLDEMRILRNSIAHRSRAAGEAFERLARNKIGYRPRGLIPGLFLNLLEPTSGSKMLNHYSTVLRSLSFQIVP
jgi:hypothetical protein